MRKKSISEKGAAIATKTWIRFISIGLLLFRK